MNSKKLFYGTIVASCDITPEMADAADECFGYQALLKEAIEKFQTTIPQGYVIDRFDNNSIKIGKSSSIHQKYLNYYESVKYTYPFPDKSKFTLILSKYLGISYTAAVNLVYSVEQPWYRPEMAEHIICIKVPLKGNPFLDDSLNLKSEYHGI